MSFKNYSLQSMTSVIIFQKSGVLLGNRKKQKKKKKEGRGVRVSDSEGGHININFK
jgi:hypothetical protein